VVYPSVADDILLISEKNFYISEKELYWLDMTIVFTKIVQFTH